MVFEDTLREPVIADSAPIKAGARFYASAPLKTADGYFIGTVCVVYFAPKSFDEHDRKILEALSCVVMEQMELRLRGIRETELQVELLEKKDELISVASHELKTSLTSPLQLLDRIIGNPKPELLDKLVTQANRSLQKLNRLISDLLDTNRISSGNLNLDKTTINPAELA